MTSNLERAAEALMPKEFKARGALMEDEILVNRLRELMRQGDEFNHLSWEELLKEARRREDVIL